MLDEPTLGLDILYRKQFYDALLNDYFDHSRTILVTTHQVEEIQHVLTDVMFMNRGRIVLDCSMEDFENRYVEVMVKPEQVAAARALAPDARTTGIRSQRVPVRSRLRSIAQLDGSLALGEARTPSIADLFVAMIGGSQRRSQRHERSNRNQPKRSPAPARAPRADPTVLLVSATRVVGEPLAVHCAAGRRRA